jgi:hypothetical protein
MIPTDHDDENEETLYISFRTRLNIIRIAGNVVLPSRLQIRADVSPDDDVTEAQLSNVMSKMKFWFDGIVSRSIAFSNDNEDALGMIIDSEGKNRTGNILMITPGDPTDDVLAALFQAKLNALGGDTIEVGLVEVKSDNPVGLSFTFVGDATKILPSMDRWMGERNYFDKPWWDRDDSSTLDVIPPEGADLTKKPGWAYSLDTVVKSERDEAVIVKPAFKPMIIDGGKKEDE